jgi:tRNA-Thr(GGU) m(6)t(6)A37 methyltransferase TsaA
MKTSRRLFMTGAAQCGAGIGLTAIGAGEVRAEAAAGEPASERKTYEIHPIGTVEKGDTGVRVRIFDSFVDGLLGLQEWSHVNIFYWFDQNDVPQKRAILQVHPQGNPENPLTGVFACRSPVRPNLIALSVCKVLSVEKNLITLDQLDAFPGTPIIDIKPFIPPDAPTKDLRMPAWTQGKKRTHLSPGPQTAP